MRRKSYDIDHENDLKGSEGDRINANRKYSSAYGTTTASTKYIWNCRLTFNH